MFDSISSDCVKPLVIRTVTGNFAIFVNFMAVKYFPLTLVAMIINCAPLVQLILAGPILGEQVKPWDTVSLLIAFVSIALVILGGETTENTSE